MKVRVISHEGKVLSRDIGFNRDFDTVVLRCNSYTDILTHETNTKHDIIQYYIIVLSLTMLGVKVHYDSRRI